jgi:hypothetical protein
MMQKKNRICNLQQLLFWHALGEAGVEELLATTVAAAVQMKAMTPAQFERVIVRHHGPRESSSSIRPTAGCSTWRAPGVRNWRNARV